MSGGGLHAKRGLKFEATALLSYILLRLSETTESFKIVFEVSQDAAITYAAREGRAAALTEIIQCKKKELQPLPETPATEGTDSWTPGVWGDGDLREMLARPTGAAPIVEQLAAGAFYTALLFGNLTRRLSKFVPPGLMSNGHSPDHATFLRGFPAEFEHQGDPDPQRKTGPVRTVQHIRVVQMPAPSLLEALCIVIVEGASFKVSPQKSSEIIRDLLARVAEQLHVHPDSDPHLRTLSSDDIRQVLLTGRRGRGAWIRGGDLLANRSAAWWGVDTLADQEIFSAGKFWRNEYMEGANDTLFCERAVVVTGPLSSGKSTICKYLIFEFLKKFPQAASYHLSVRPGADLDDELLFFKDNLDLPTLFVIDDEQNATARVANFAQAFLTPTTKAFLVVGSSHTYSRTQAGRYENPLHEFPSVTIEDFEPCEIRDLLSCDLPGIGSPTAAQADFIAEVREASNGRIGLALLVARCFRGMPARRPSVRLLDTDAAKQAVKELLVGALKLVDPGDFEGRVLPVLLITGQGIGIPLELNHAVVGMLCSVGVLVPIQTDSGERYLASDEALSLVLSRQYRHLVMGYLSRYLRDFPHELCTVCCSLATQSFGRQILRGLMDAREPNFAIQLREELERSLGDFATTLSAITQASPDLSRKLLREAVAPHRQVNRTLAARIVALDAPSPVKTGTSLLASMRRLDRGLVRSLFEAIVGRTTLTDDGYTRARSLVVKLTAESLQLNDALNFIVALRQCHYAFGKAAFDIFMSSPVFRRKVDALLPISATTIVDVVDACRPLRALSHDAFGVFVAEVLLEEPLRESLLRCTNTRAALRLMRVLRRVHPRLAIDIVWGLWRKHRDWLSAALRSAADVVDGVGLLSALASIDKRVAIQFARSEQGFLCDLALHAPQYNRLASALAIVSRLSPELAARMAAQVDVSELTERLNGEQHRITLVGRTLTSYAAILPSLSFQAVVGLNLPSLYARISPRAFLYTFVFLTRGILEAKLCEPYVNPHQTIRDFVEQLGRNSNVIDRLKEIMEQPNDVPSVSLDVREFALAFSQLFEIGFSMEDLFGLYGIANAADMLTRIRAWIAIAADVVGVRQLLYAMLLLPDPSYAEEGLAALVELVRTGNFARTIPAPPHSATPRVGHRRGGQSSPGRPWGREITDITEMGDLLRLSAAIDDRQAGELVENFIDRMAEQCRRDRNLGRHAVLLHGLNEASRTASKRLVKEVFGEDVEDNHVIEMLDENEKLENILHLVEQLQIVDTAAADRILRLGIERSQERLLALAGVDANLHSLSRWLRMLHHHPTAAPETFQEQIIQLMLEQRQYDERLISAIEATVALIDIGRIDQAGKFVSDLGRLAKQARSIQSANVLIEQFLKLIRIDQALSTSCLHAVLAELPASSLAIALRLREEPALSGFLYWLIRNHIQDLALSYESLLSTAHTDLSSLLGRLRTSPLTMIARMLLEQPPATVRAYVRSIDPEVLLKWRPWEIGLVETVWQAVYGGSGQTLVNPEDFWGGLSDDRRRTISEERYGYLSPDAPNIKFALSMRSSVDIPKGQLRGAVRRDATTRLQNEIRNAVRLLLDADFNAASLAGHPYYFKVLLADTAFVPYRFDWSERIAVEVHADIFEHSL